MTFNLTNQWKAKLSTIIIPRKQLWPTINFCSEDKRSITWRNPTAERIFDSSPLRFSSSTSFYKKISVGYWGKRNRSKLHGMLLCIHLLSEHKISNSYRNAALPFTEHPAQNAKQQVVQSSWSGYYCHWSFQSNHGIRFQFSSTVGDKIWGYWKNEGN